MYRTTVELDGSIRLGLAAECAGFQPGQTVDVIVTRAGSLIVAIAEAVEEIELQAARLPAGRARQLVLEGKRG
jgi:hypothetical protein